MSVQLTVEDSISAVKDWEDYLGVWMADLKTQKQVQPNKEQIDSMREIWLEGYFRGRMSK